VEYSTFMTDDSTSCHVMVEILCFPTLGWNFSTIFIYSASKVRLFVRLSVTLVVCDHIGWKSWKLIARAISLTPSFFAAIRRSTYSEENMGKFWGD